MQWGLPQAGAIVADKYVITRLLGRGGMGAVYVVEHRITGKRLALKCLLPEHLEHPEFTERFLREAQAAGRIQHRNVVDVFDVGRDGNVPYIVMELLEGKSLADMLREGKLTLEETLQIVLRAAEGVAAAHDVGIVHRDLKPDNIFVCVGQSGELDDPRVLDFGISKLEDDLNKPLTKSGVMLGTPYYMAFEQINSQRDLDLRVDVYAMGVILYEAMAGQPPYVAESVGALAIRMMSAPPVPISQLRPELPEGLTDLVMRSIARDRDERFPSMRAFIDALRPFATDSARLLVPKGRGTPLGGSLRSAHAVDATLPALSPTPAHPLKSSARLRLRVAEEQGERTPSIVSSSRTLLWVAGIALLLILGGGGVMLSMRDGAPTEEQADVPAPAPPAGEPRRAKAPPGARGEAPRAAPADAREQRTAGEESAAGDSREPAVEERGANEKGAKSAARPLRGRRKPVRAGESEPLPQKAPAPKGENPASLAPPAATAPTPASEAPPVEAESPDEAPAAPADPEAVTPPAAAEPAAEAPVEAAPAPSPAAPPPDAPPSEPPAGELPKAAE